MNFLPEGIYFKRIQAKEFLAFKGGKNLSSWVYAKVTHGEKDGSNFINVRLGFTDVVLWPLIPIAPVPIALCYAWFVPDFIDRMALLFFTAFFLISAVMLYFYLRWNLKSFEKDLRNFFTELNPK